MTRDRKAAASSTPVVRSALWAAWGDAVGFPLELTRDEQQVQRRLATVSVNMPVGWSRRVGGRYGPTVPLPAGTYSDDTQLRLAVGRCIRSANRFDAEAFSKIELPVFLSYGLGIGRGTRAAAKSLEKRGVRWYSNFYADGVRYVDGGGNGAAMRIQPHVWSSPGFRPEAYLANVIRDTVATHGHPRAVVGAAFHALALGTTLREGAVPASRRWAAMVGYLERLVEIFNADEVLAEQWVPRWERETGVSWKKAVSATLREAAEYVDFAARSSSHDGDVDAYSQVAGRMGGLDPATRGSGLVAAVLALWLASGASDAPARAPILAANLIGSDTDTIASMAGALTGAVADQMPPGDLLDIEYIAAEAARLERLHDQRPAESFPHPDPLKWKAPRALTDVVGTIDGEVAVAGLGVADPIGPVHTTNSNAGAGWQWLHLRYGQHVLIKRREQLEPLPDYWKPRRRMVRALQEELPLTPGSDGGEAVPESVDEAVELLVRSGFDATLAMRILRSYVDDEQGFTKAGIFGALVIRALRDHKAAAERASSRRSDVAAAAAKKSRRSSR